MQLLLNLPRRPPSRRRRRTRLGTKQKAIGWRCDPTAFELDVVHTSTPSSPALRIVERSMVRRWLALRFTQLWCESRWPRAGGARFIDLGHHGASIKPGLAACR